MKIDDSTIISGVQVLFLLLSGNKAFQKSNTNQQLMLQGLTDLKTNMTEQFRHFEERLHFIEGIVMGTKGAEKNATVNGTAFITTNAGSTESNPGAI